MDDRKGSVRPGQAKGGAPESDAARAMREAAEGGNEWAREYLELQEKDELRASRLAERTPEKSASKPSSGRRLKSIADVLEDYQGPDDEPPLEELAAGGYLLAAQVQDPDRGERARSVRRAEARHARRELGGKRYTKEQREAFAERDSKTRKRRLEKLAKGCAERGFLKCAPEVIPPDFWRVRTMILTDHTGYAARHFARIEDNRIAMGLLLKAATNDGRYGFEGDRPGNVRARRLLVLGLLFLTMGRRTLRKGRFVFLLKGVPIKAMRAAVSSPCDDATNHDNWVCRSTVCGKWGAALGESGYLKALKEVGFLYSRQLIWSGDGNSPPPKKGWTDITPNEYANTGRYDPKRKIHFHYSLNRYFVITDYCEAAAAPDVSAFLDSVRRFVDETLGQHGKLPTVDEWAAWAPLPWEGRAPPAKPN